MTQEISPLLTRQDSEIQQQSPFAVIGAGFWAEYQLAAWQEVEGAKCVAICDADIKRAQHLAERFHVPHVYADARAMFAEQELTFADIVSSPASHCDLVLLCAEHRLPVICQKPMTNTWSDCLRMVESCRRTGTWFAIHENWRWQRPLRRIKELLNENCIGKVIRCHIDFITGFDVFANQPTLRNETNFIIADLGVHLLDYARCLMGEADWICSKTVKTDTTLAGENVATILMSTDNEQSMTVVQMAYAQSPMEFEHFPQSHVFIEGIDGSLELDRDHRIHITTKQGTKIEQAAPLNYAWANPRYAVVHSSLVDCNRHLFKSQQANREAETSGSDNLRTMQLVFAAYESARERAIVPITPA